MTDSLRSIAAESPIEPLVEGLFGPTRRLYKRLAQFDCFEHPEIHRGLARRPFEELVEYSQRLAERIAITTGQSISPIEVLIDAPPAKLEVQSRIAVRNPNGDFCSLEELSPVVRALATQQFDDVVKKVRLFVSPRIRELCQKLNVTDLVHQVLAD